MAEEKIQNIAKEETTQEEVSTQKALPSDQVNDFVTDNANKLLKVLVVVAVIVGAWFIYQNNVVLPAEEEGKNKIFMAQYYFQAGDLESALNGKEGNAGFIELVEENGSNKIGNLASFYAGQIFLQQGQYQKAIDYLEKFSSKDAFAGALALSSIGDAYAEMEETNKAISYYKKAASYSKNSFTTPLYLMKLANVLSVTGNAGEALGYYEMIKKDYPNSNEGRDIEKYIAKARAQK